METEIEKLKQLRADREKMKQRQETTLVTREKEKQGGNDVTATVCPECGSKQLVHDYERAELVCQHCGLVLDDDFIDRGPEWRAF